MDIPLPAWLLITATLLPLAAFVILVFWGKKMGNPFAGYLASTFIAVSFICSLAAMILWVGRPDDSTWGFEKGPINSTFGWIPVGTWPGQRHPGFLDLGVYVDSLTVIMFNMVTLVSTLIFVFSIGYMREDKRYPRFFTYLSLFDFSMLGLVLGGTVLQLFIFWELVGLCSYLLIGFWYEKKSASNAAIKAFVTNRVGDFGFLIGFGILFYHLGNMTLPDMWIQLGAAGGGQAIKLSTGAVFSSTLLTVMGIGLFFGAVGKSAQFPLHVWLPDAMEGPTPVSALIHAATMVAAGVYLVGRIFPVLTPDAKLFIAIIGCITLTMAALIAVVQSDIKKVLAYSTLSQLGYMILAMGVGSWVGGLFHLITHAFFKALLFLGSGSVIHAAHHEQELPQYGGLMRKIPITAVTFAIAVLAIAGFGIAGVGFAGYYSKDMILAHAAAFGFAADHSGKSGWYWALFILPVGIAFVTPFYMTRCWMLTFWGKPRNPHIYEHAHELPVMWVPLAVLALLSVIGGGFLGVKQYLNASIVESTAYCRAVDREFNGFATAWPSDPPGHRAADAEGPEPAHAAALTPSQQWHLEGEHRMHTALAGGFAWLIGIAAGFFMYMNGYAVADRLMKLAPLRWVHTWLYRRMYFDELYFSVFVALTLAASKLSAAFDKYVVDGIVNLAGWLVKQAAVAVGLHDKYVIDGAVNGVAALSQELGAVVRAPQTGRIRVYVTILMAAVSLGLAGAIIVVLSR
ncbi:NADH-quinone oxidoreductase subunit L [Fontivita pretiosa]|uniref:NADH-quinone oxidoreductase subunit L n=1 Tax=Fontivita pretiosa TaxID=2989684 RepID=UPI003D17143A